MAEGGIWDQEFMTQPPPQPTHALLPVCQVLLLSCDEAAPPGLIKLPITLSAAQLGCGSPADRTPCVHRQKRLEVKPYARDQILRLTLQTIQVLATLFPAPSILIPLFFGGPSEAMYFLCSDVFSCCGDMLKTGY